jgi:hypothetical protein
MAAPATGRPSSFSAQHSAWTVGDPAVTTVGAIARNLVF